MVLLDASEASGITTPSYVTRGVGSHHGAITVYSEVDTGTVFHIYLPCLDTIGEHAIFTPPRERSLAIMVVISLQNLRKYARFQALDNTPLEPWHRSLTMNLNPLLMPMWRVCFRGCLISKNESIPRQATNNSGNGHRNYFLTTTHVNTTPR